MERDKPEICVSHTGMQSTSLSSVAEREGGKEVSFKQKCMLSLEEGVGELFRFKEEDTVEVGS